MARWLVPVLLLLSACDRPVTESQARQIAEDEADAKVAQLEQRVDTLETKLDGLRQQADGLQTLSMENSNNLASLAKTVNHNAQANNENAARDMTRRAACGTRLVQQPWGVQNQIVPCTKADLKP